MHEIWIVGATGRTGRRIATLLAARGLPLALVGRDAARLRELAGTLGGDPRIVPAGSVDAVAGELAHNSPAVVVNTVGPFFETAAPIVRACRRGTHYVDLANGLGAVREVLGKQEEAVAGDRSLVTGAGFGVLATESLVLKLCDGRPPAERVRVDALSAVESEPGTALGQALAGSVVGSLAAGGRRYEHGRLVRALPGHDAERLELPGGGSVETGGLPSGELEAAQRASGAPFVVAASGAAPTGRAVRAVLAAVLPVLAVPAIRRVATRLLARVRASEGRPEREYSLAHARVWWPDGSTGEGWLRAGDGMEFTAAVAAEVAARLANGEGSAGAYTPGALFGPELAESAGAHFLPEHAPGVESRSGGK